MEQRKRFGGGRKPTGTPSLAWSCVVVVASLLGGAAIVHNIYKPNLTLQPAESVGGAKENDGGRELDDGNEEKSHDAWETLLLPQVERLLIVLPSEDLVQSPPKQWPAILCYHGHKEENKGPVALKMAWSMVGSTGSNCTSSMQTPKKSSSRDATSKQPHKTSPGTPHAARRLRLSGSQSNSPASKSPTSNNLIRASPRGPATEKRTNRIAELESRISRLEEDLENTKNQLTLSESQRLKAQQEANEAKEQLVEVKSELEHADRQLRELCESEDSRIQELRKIGQERDRAWQSELEAVQKQHSIESSALLAAVNEIQRLRIHCDMLVGSEIKRAEKAGSELCNLKQELAGKDSLVDTLRNQIMDLEKTEAEYQESINTVHLQLEMAKNTITVLRADGSKLVESLNSITSGLHEPKVKTNESATQIHSSCEVIEQVRAESNCREAELLKELEEARLEITELIEYGKCHADPIKTEKVNEKPESNEVAIDNSSGEQLKAARAMNSEMEAELQRVRVQAQQWRKAAEMAVAIIANADNGTAAEKTTVFNANRSCEEEKKNLHMLKKIGVLLKKGQK